MNKVEYKELIAFHPGYYLKEMIKDMGITQEEFAKRLGTTGKNLSDLLNGKSKLSNELAVKLSAMFGTSVQVWLNLQNNYTEKVLEIDCRKTRDKEAESVQLIDYKYFVNLGVVPKVKSSSDKADELLKWFKISSFDVLRRRDFLVNYRMASDKTTEKKIMNSNAWVQTALNIGTKMNTDPFDSKRLQGYIGEIRKMTLQNPSSFTPRLKEILALCGVALVFLPHLKNSGVHGAVKWIEKEKAILALSDRRSFADSFWFSLFHELGHIMQKRVAMLIVCRDIDEMDDINKELEMEANKFAQDTLLPTNSYGQFVSNGDFSETAIKQFADKIEIHPGIVVGRLQLEKHIGYDRHNRLRDKYVIKNA